MSEEGFVPRETVLAVLRGCDVAVAEGFPDNNPDAHQVTLSKGSIVEVQYLPEMVPRRLVLRFAHKFDVAAHFFWHPEKMPSDRQAPGLLSN